ncbi:TniQ family protein [Pseudokineococcus basanitobsidens]|uniref:TniQ family protein n=1 Tax=Pseudokineococcus basanitobsidens TaxID=1926649 RepID=A0ABU8RPJ6_9ACTN
MPWQTPAGLRAARAARRPLRRVAAPTRVWRDGTPGIGRWPITVPPVPGEQVQGWLARVGYRYDLSPHQWLEAAGARTNLTEISSAAEHLRRHHAAVTTALGLDGLPLGAAGDQLARQLAEAVAAYRRDYRGDSVRAVALDGTRYCPVCLADNGGVWPQRWRSPLHLVCTDHEVLLESICPACEKSPWSTSVWTTRACPPWACPEHAPGPHTLRTRFQPCRHDLRTTAPRDATAGQIGLQRWVFALASVAAGDPHGPVTVAGLPSTHGDHLTALLDLLDEHALGSYAIYDAATDGARVLAGLAAAADVVGSLTPAEAAAAADAHGLLDPAGQYTPIAGETRGRRRHPVLGEVRLLSVAAHLSPPAQLTFRTGRAHPRYPSHDLGPHHPGDPSTDRVPLAWIAQQLWPGVLAEHLDAGDYKARACAAMLLARLGAPRPWQLIAVDLGLPRSLVSYVPAMVRRLRRTGAWPDFLAGLEDLADHLHAAPPTIDYSDRRWIGGDAKMLRAALTVTRYELCLGPTMTVSPALVRVFWETYTGGDARLCRAPVALADADHAAHRAFAAKISDSCDEWFTHAAHYLAAKTDTGGDESLWWLPP